MRSDKFGSQLDRKIKTWFFTFLNVYVSRIERDKILISQLSPPKFRYFAEQNGPKGGRYENEFWQFWNTKMNIINRTQKLDEKNGVICLVFFFPSWVTFLKLPKIIHFFCKFVLTSARNLNLLKQFIYICLKNFIMLLRKIVFYRGLSHSSKDNEDWNFQKKCGFSKNLTKLINSKCQYLLNCNL